MPVGTASVVFFPAAEVRPTKHNSTGVTHIDQKKNFTRYVSLHLSLCLFGLHFVAMPSATITSLCKVTPLNMNFPFNYLQEEVPGKAIVASQFCLPENS